LVPEERGEGLVEGKSLGKNSRESDLENLGLWPSIKEGVLLLRTSRGGNDRGEVFTSKSGSKCVGKGQSVLVWEKKRKKSNLRRNN